MIKVINTPSLFASLHKAIEFCRNKIEDIEIIVPDKLALFMEKFLFEKLQISASFNLKVSTLNRYAKKRCVVAKENLISDVGSVLLIHKIMNDNINNLTTLKSKAYSFSYAENIMRTINQFKASKITHEEMEKFTSTNTQLQNKILDLALIYREYESNKAGLLDSADLFLMSTMFITNDSENKQFLFVGFDDFTAIEYSIIERLAEKNFVNILLNYADGKNKSLYNQEIFSQLKNICYINDYDFKVETCNLKFTNLKKYLHDNLFGLTNEKFVLDNELIKVFAGNNVGEEIEFVARDIRYKILNGANYDNFGVAVYNLENNTNNIKEIFSKYEINYYLDAQMMLNKSILYKFLCSVFKYNLENYNLCHLIDLISSPFLMLKKEDKQKIIDKLITINFKGRIDKFTSNELTDEFTKTIEFVKSFSFKSLDTINNVITKIKSSIECLNFDETISLICDSVDIKETLLLKKSKEKIYSLFDEILKFNNNISVEEFFDIFLHSAGVIKIKNVPLSLDAVKVVDANNTMEIFNNLYVVNCTSDTAPNFKYDCGIILDTEIEQLNFKHKLNPTIAHINKLSKLRLFNSSLLFNNELVVTYSLKQSDLVKELCAKIQVETKVGNLNIQPIVDFKLGKYIALSKNDYIEYLCKNEKNNLKINEKYIKNKDFSNISEKNLNIFENLIEISASQLENYFKCPFYEFLNNTLKINERNKPDILAFDIGNILHEILFKYYSCKKQISDVYNFCKDEVFKFVNKDERLKLNLNSPILVSLIDEAVRVVNAVNYIDENSTFVPMKFEYEFKGVTALKLNNISIKGKVDRVDISDDLIRIIDYKSGRAEASLKELFYGNKLQLFLYASAIENILNKHIVGSFYLPLRNDYSASDKNRYMFKGYFLNEDFVVRAMDKRLNIGDDSDIFDITVNKDYKAGRTKDVKKLESDQFKSLQRYAQKVTEQAVEEIKSGYILPSPTDVGDACKNCAYKHICLKNCADRKVRVSGSVNLDSFKEVKDE